MTVGAVLWDGDGVLQRAAHGGEESMRAAVAGRLDDDDVDAFLAEAVAAERPALRGEVAWLDVLPCLLRRWGLAGVYDDVVRVWLGIEEVPGSRALVAAVRAAGTDCYLASNQDRHRAEVMERELGYPALLDGSLYSCDLGAAKPDPAFFRAAAERLRRPVSALVLVDDVEANVEAARSVGMAACTWCHRDGVDALAAELQRLGVPLGRR